MENFCIIIPSPQPNGPTKGAFALANEICELPNLKIFIIYLKEGPGVNLILNKKVKVINLSGQNNNLFSKIFQYRKFLKSLGGKDTITSLSMCFSADFVNSYCKNQANTIASIRCNLYDDYRFLYGLFGIILAEFHFKFLKKFNHVVSMSKSMQTQIRRRSKIESTIIPNFIDESNLEKYKNKKVQKSKNFKFIFVGTLSKRKRPYLLVKAMEKFKDQNITLEIIGDGPLYSKLKKEIISKGLNEKVYLHGFLKNPYEIMSNCDSLILPSLSEGSSRAVLEALHLGLVCVINNVDGNKELSMLAKDIILINNQEEIFTAMKKAVIYSRRDDSRESKLPSSFRQKNASMQYLRLR